MENSVINVPIIKVSTIKKSENGLPELKQLNLPNNKIEQTNQLNNVADGTYYSIYEICEIIDRHIMNEYVIAYDTQTGKNYKLTEEIQYLLEKVPKNLHFSRNDLPGKFGYYIHEKAMEAIFKRLEKRPYIEKYLKELFFGRHEDHPKEPTRTKKSKGIREAQERYLKEETKPKTYSKVKPQKITKNITKATAALLIVAAATIAIATPKEPTEDISYTEPTQISTVYTEADIQITNEELCAAVILGEAYRINQTTIYEASDHTGRTGTIKEGYYKIAIISIVDENNIIRTINVDKDEYKKVSDLISTIELQKAKYKSAAIASSDGTILGWIDISTENFKELAEQIKTENITKISLNNQGTRGR